MSEAPYPYQRITVSYDEPGPAIVRVVCVRLRGEALTCTYPDSGALGGHTPTALPDPGVRTASESR
ncbi:hypothetical protein [Streptomyces tubercidicus]|uniref:hypothetical protein n=1 Tax=Streptomyces tubercidicus TaxID=47759 RepID=UPI0036790B4F